MGIKIKGCYNVNFWVLYFKFLVCLLEVLILPKVLVLIFLVLCSSVLLSCASYFPLLQIFVFANGPECVCPYILWSETSLVIFSESHSDQLLGEAGMCLYLLLKCSHELEGGFGGKFLKIYLFIYFWLLALGLHCCEQVFPGCSERELLSSCGTQVLGTWASAVVM